MTEKTDNTADKKPDSVTSSDQPQKTAATEKQFDAVPPKKKEEPKSTAAPSSSSQQPLPAAKAKSGRSAAPVYGLLLVVVALAGAGLWYQNETINTLKSDIQSQLAGNASAARQAQQQAEQASSLTREQGAKLAALSNSYQRSQEQYQDLSQAFQALTDKGSDLILLNDIDHLASIAQQQLMLGGNVANAIIALESAQAQLARANRVRLASLQQTINGDLDRLRAVATVDADALSRQLDTLGSLLAQAPLLVPDDVAAGATGEPITQGSDMAVPVELGPDATWWERSWNLSSRWAVQAWRSLSHDLGQFVSIRRVDDAAALMMSPDQAASFRESMNLRVMTAQLAMMMNQSDLWQKELGALEERLNRRYDLDSSKTQQAVRLLRQLQDTQIGQRLPTVDNTLAAIETLRQEELDQPLHSDQDARQDVADPDSTDEQDQLPESEGSEANADQSQAAAWRTLAG